MVGNTALTYLDVLNRLEVCRKMGCPRPFLVLKFVSGITHMPSPVQMCEDMSKMNAKFLLAEIRLSGHLLYQLGQMFVRILKLLHQYGPAYRRSFP